MEDNVGRYAPSRFQDLSFAELPLRGIAERHAAAAATVRRFADRIDDNVRTGSGLWLLGNKGTGKTTLAYYVAQQARAAGLSVLTRNTTDLLNEIRDSYKVDAQPTTREIINAVTHVDLLHLEDVAVPRPNDWVLEQLYTIVNRRYEYNKAIVFTSDFPYGEHVMPGEARRAHRRADVLAADADGRRPDPDDGDGLPDGDRGVGLGGRRWRWRWLVRSCWQRGAGDSEPNRRFLRVGVVLNVSHDAQNDTDLKPARSGSLHPPYPRTQ